VKLKSFSWQATQVFSSLSAIGGCD